MNHRIYLIILLIGLLTGFLLPTAKAEDPCSRVSLLLTRVEELRQLRAIEPITCLSLPDEGYSRRVIASLQENNQETRMAYEEIVYRTLGIIPADYNYKDCVLNGSGDTSYAWYDRKTRVIYLRQSGIAHDAVIAHEIVHALQDQHFNLTKFHSHCASSDCRLARMAVVEGDAVNIERQFEVKGAQPKDSATGYSARCEPPEALFNIFMFPYEWGEIFISALPKERRNQAFLNRPNSTRDIIYPKIFVERGRFLQKRLIEGLAGVYEDVLGEFSLRALLKNFTDPAAAILAAKGWESDRLTLRKISHGKFHLSLKLEFSANQDIDQALHAIRLYCLNHFGLSIDANARRWEGTSHRGIRIVVKTSPKRGLSLDLIF